MTHSGHRGRWGPHLFEIGSKGWWCDCNGRYLPLAAKPLFQTLEPRQLTYRLWATRDALCGKYSKLFILENGAIV